MSDDTLARWAADMNVPVDDLRNWSADDWRAHLALREAEVVVASVPGEHLP